LYKTAARQPSGKFVFQVNTDVVQVKVLEIAESTEVVEHQDGHNFALGHFARTVTVLLSVFGQTGYFFRFF
jgi:hypothetical protein